MDKLRFIHTADWHADNDPNKQKKLEDSLKQILEYVKENKVNAVIHAGDIWEKKQIYAQNSGVPMVILYLRAISKYVDFIFITKGNNSHDEPGSVSLLYQLEENIFAYEHPVVLSVHNEDGINLVKDLIRYGSDPDEFTPDYIVSLIPYPQKSGFITNTSIDNNNANFLENFEQVFEHIGDITKSYTCPKLLAFHGNVVGSRLSTGQTLVSQDIMVAPSTLLKAKADYYALGHIHLRQFIYPNMGYSGSIYNKSWGETEQKSFEVVEFDKGIMTSFIVPLTAARPMITVDAEFVDNDFKWDLSITNNIGDNAEFRFRCKVKENERNLITDDKIEFLKNFFGEDVKIEFNIVPIERESRSERIMNCRDLLGEVIEYAKVIDHKIDNSVMTKVAEIQEVGL